MAYSSNYYNYQIAIIFGILIAGCLLLALTIGAIYFLCVYKNDDEKKKRAAAFNNQSSAWQPTVQPGGYTNLNAPPSMAQPVDYLPPRTPVQQQSYAPPPPSAYSQQPLMMPYTTGGQPVYRTIAPDTVYQQGPTTYRTVTPVQQEGYGGAQAFNYHTSSV